MSPTPQKSKEQLYREFDSTDWRAITWHFYKKVYDAKGIEPKPRHKKRLEESGFEIACRITGRGQGYQRYQSLLWWYLPTRLLKEEFTKRDYLMSKIAKDDTWLGGSLIVPFTAIKPYRPIPGFGECKE